MFKRAMALLIFPILVGGCATQQLAKNKDDKIARSPASDFSINIDQIGVSDRNLGHAPLQDGPIADKSILMNCSPDLVLTTSGWVPQKGCDPGFGSSNGDCLPSMEVQSFSGCPRYIYSTYGWLQKGACSPGFGMYNAMCIPAPFDPPPGSCPSSYKFSAKKNTCDPDVSN